MSQNSKSTEHEEETKEHTVIESETMSDHFRNDQSEHQYNDDYNTEQKEEQTEIDDIQIEDCIIKMLGNLQLARPVSFYAAKFKSAGFTPRHFQQFRYRLTASDFKDIGIDSKIDQLLLMQAARRITPTVKPTQSLIKHAWLSAETTIEEINVLEQYFKMRGWLTVFWRDAALDQNETLKSLLLDKKYSYSLCFDMLLDGRFDLKEQAMRTTDNFDFFVVREIEAYQDDPDHEQKKYIKQKYIKLTGFIDKISKKYPMPFRRVEKDDTFYVFRNAMEYELIGSNPIELDYNIDHQTFKLHIHFRTTLYECFENNYCDFPFEWQFLNAHIVYDVKNYAFFAKIPDFVQHAFCIPEYWEHSKTIWKNAVLARKRDNIAEWTLLAPWVDLRNETERKKDYEHDFHFGLIKYRIKRNPHYYLLYIVVPLCLMGLCAFAVFAIDHDEGINDRLSYLITLLLTVAAFQLSISADLPYQWEFTLIDKYFLLAYFILAILVLESVILEIVNMLILDIVFGAVCIALWLFYSAKFLRKFIYYKRTVEETFIHYQRDFCTRTNADDQIKYWLVMAKNESAAWDIAIKLMKKSEKPEYVLGTEGDIYTYNKKTDECGYKPIDKDLNIDCQGDEHPSFDDDDERDKHLLEVRDKWVKRLGGNDSMKNDDLNPTVLSSRKGHQRLGTEDPDDV